ncbi:hypothetical protein Droror1_Dr00006279 [Drosera rotundifolia]
MGMAKMTFVKMTATQGGVREIEQRISGKIRDKACDSSICGQTKILSVSLNPTIPVLLTHVSQTLTASNTCRHKPSPHSYTRLRPPPLPTAMPPSAQLGVNQQEGTRESLLACLRPLHAPPSCSTTGSSVKRRVKWAAPRRSLASSDAAGPRPALNNGLIGPFSPVWHELGPNSGSNL